MIELLIVFVDGLIKGLLLCALIKYLYLEGRNQ